MKLCPIWDSNIVHHSGKNYFLPALEDGAIEPMYPEQPNHPKQKYRTHRISKRVDKG